MGFNQLGLTDAIVHGVQSMGYIDPTPIQLRAIPVILAGRDLVASAQTGTGKTAAFSLPILSKLAQPGGCRCLILEPTRELAAQVETACFDYARLTRLKTLAMYGGVGYGAQKEALKRGVDVVVATPGRLLDHLEQGTFDLSKVKYLVLDEVDRMLDMGFLPDVKKIVQRCPRDRQTLLFSATLPPEIESLASWALREPEKIEIGGNRSPADTVTHAFYPVATSQKFDLLVALLEKTNYDSVLIFTRTKHEADRICHKLKEMNHAVAALHANRTQRDRMEALEGFKAGKYEILVATDIAARGIDIAGVTHVVNYDVPQHPEDYVHRIGRTGRAQMVGDAFTLITAEEMEHVQSIERFIGQAVPRMKLDGFTYVYSTVLNTQTEASSKSLRGGRTLRGFSFGRRR